MEVNVVQSKTNKFCMTFKDVTQCELKRFSKREASTKPKIKSIISVHKVRSNGQRMLSNVTQQSCCCESTYIYVYTHIYIYIYIYKVTL
jgi:hypothetical protein